MSDRMRRNQYSESENATAKPTIVKIIPISSILKSSEKLVNTTDNWLMGIDSFFAPSGMNPRMVLGVLNRTKF